MKWNGKDYRPLVPQKIVFKEEKFDVEEYLKSLAEKHDRMPVWRAIPNPIAVNVPVSTGPQPTPSITPSNTATQTPTGTPTNTPTNTITQTQTQTPTNTPTPSTSAPPSGTTEANAYLSAVVNAGGTGITMSISAATRTLFTSIVSNGLWDKLTAFYPLIGGNAVGCAVEGKTYSTNNLTFNGGWAFNASGATSNGTNTYADVPINDNTMSQNDSHYSIYSRNDVASAADSFGVWQGTLGNGVSMTLRFSDNNIYARNHDGGGGTGNTSSRGYFISNRTSSTRRETFRNGTTLGSQAVNSVALLNSTYYLGAQKQIVPSAINNYDAKQYCFVSLGQGFTPAQAATFSTIINTFNTSLNRNTF